jgi:hypothetical protein
MRNALLHQRQQRVTTHRPNWSMAQIVQGIAGLLLVVLGGIVFAKVGLKFDPPGRADVLFTQTTWLATIEIVLGILFLAGATSARDRSMAMFAALATVAVGIILAAVPEAASGRLVGGDSSPGIVLALIGAVTAVMTMVAPDRLAVERERLDDQEIV